MILVWHGAIISPRRIYLVLCLIEHIQFYVYVRRAQRDVELVIGHFLLQKVSGPLRQSEPFRRTVPVNPVGYEPRNGTLRFYQTRGRGNGSLLWQWPCSYSSDLCDS